MTIKDTTSLKNTVALSGPFAANGNLIFQKGYGFLKKIIQKADSIYTGKGLNLTYFVDNLDILFIQVGIH